MTTQLYRITRAGAQFVRLEWPDGQPVRGPRMVLNSQNNFVPRRNEKGESYERVVYGANRVDPRTGLPVTNFRNEIRLTAVGAAMLKHLGLVPIFGSMHSAPAEGSSQSQQFNDDYVPVEDVVLTEPLVTDLVTIPVDWQSLNISVKSKFAAQILGEPFRPMKSEQANAIIQEYIDETLGRGDDGDDSEADDS